MPRSPLVTVLLLLSAVALLANPVWFFPADGETRHTYTRVPVEVADNRLAYDPPASGGSYQPLNDLEGIGCDYSDSHPESRGCAFDRYLVKEGPVTVAGGDTGRGGPAFVFLNGSFYQRVEEPAPESDGQRYDVVRVSPDQVLDVIAQDDFVSDPRFMSDHDRLLRQGGTIRSTAPPQDHALGRVYDTRHGYYTVALVETARLDHPFVSPGIRVLLGLIGAGLLVLAWLRVTWSRREARTANQ